MSDRRRPRTRGGRLVVCALGAVALAVLANATVLRADVPNEVHAPGAQWAPAVAAGPDHTLAVWHDMRPVSSISGTRVSPAGEILDPDQIWISLGGSGTRNLPDVAF